MQPIKVFGYHGTTAKASEAILRDGFRDSENDHDWLGKGIYFFQDAPARAWERADQQAAKVGGDPAVIKAEILLDDCMDLLDISWVDFLAFAYNGFCEQRRRQGEPLPSQTKRAHRLDRGVIDYAVQVFNDNAVKVLGRSASIGVVRGIFVEGNPVFPDSHLYDRAHVQIAVRRSGLIQGKRLARRNEDG